MRTIIEMVNLTRLDCAIASAGQMRMALSQALHHIRHRIGVPEAARRPAADARRCWPTWRSSSRRRWRWCSGSCRAFDRAARDPAKQRYARLLTPAVKFLVCKSTPQLVYEALGVPGRQRLHRGPAAGAALSARRRSTPSGKAPATSWRSTCCAPPAAIPSQAMATVGALDEDGFGRVRRATARRDARRGAALGRRRARARFLCEGSAKIAALAALAEAKSQFATLYGDTRLGGTQVLRSSAPPISEARKPLCWIRARSLAHLASRERRRGQMAQPTTSS